MDIFRHMTLDEDLDDEDERLPQDYEPLTWRERALYILILLPGFMFAAGVCYAAMYLINAFLQA